VVGIIFINKCPTYAYVSVKEDEVIIDENIVIRMVKEVRDGWKVSVYGKEIKEMLRGELKVVKRCQDYSISDGKKTILMSDLSEFIEINVFEGETVEDYKGFLKARSEGKIRLLETLAF
jgi:hypothetical protein